MSANKNIMVTVETPYCCFETGIFKISKRQTENIDLINSFGTYNGKFEEFTFAEENGVVVINT
jgi:hypothetical protein